MRFSVAIFLMFTILTFTMVVSAGKGGGRGGRGRGGRGRGGRGGRGRGGRGRGGHKSMEDSLKKGKGDKQAISKPIEVVKGATGEGVAGLGGLGFVVAGLSDPVEALQGLHNIAPVPGLD